MKSINIFCFGFGQVAKNFIKKLIMEKYDIKLTITSRNKTQKKKFNGINYKSYLFNSDKFDDNLIVELKEADHIFSFNTTRKTRRLSIKKFL